MSPGEYAATINRTPRCVQKWCAAKLIGTRVGGRWEIQEGTPVPQIERRKVGRVKRSGRQTVFKRKVIA